MSQAGSFTDVALRQEEGKGPAQHASTARAARRAEPTLKHFHGSKLLLNSKVNRWTGRGVSGAGYLFCLKSNLGLLALRL